MAMDGVGGSRGEPADPLKDFASRLRQLQVESGGPSVRQLERLTRNLGVPFTRSTIHDKLTGRSAPTWEFAETFVRACALHSGTGEPDLGPWRTWHLQTVREVAGARAGGQQPGGSDAATRLPDVPPAALPESQPEERSDDPPKDSREPSSSGSNHLQPLRRWFLGGCVAAVPVALIALVGDRVLGATRQDPREDGGPPGPDWNKASPSVTLTVPEGTWQAVMPSVDLDDGQPPHPFETDNAYGFVRRENGQIQAVSGICTHQGCRLALDPTNRQLSCPCHGAVFALGGRLLRHRLPAPPAPLPRLPVREVDGDVQVLLPRPAFSQPEPGHRAG